jgi:hypothetical protein
MSAIAAFSVDADRVLREIRERWWRAGRRGGAGHAEAYRIITPSPAGLFLANWPEGKVRAGPICQSA